MSTGLDSTSNVEDTLADDRQAPRRTQPHALVGEKIGRYVVLQHVGSGAMGVVYGAYDPELDRKVALKLLHRGPSDDLELQTRLLREAQAMARLTHPQVVTVHDVGTHEQQIFVAMEFIEGHTLGEWLRADTRSWPEVLAVFAAAGEGLVAAHAAGLVHRDFKPDNVLVGHDGQVRVVDFGLVQTSGETRSSVSDNSELLDSSLSLLDSIDVDLTRTGAMLGTPAYMSPEQFSRLPLDPRSDQFSFCAALYEALYKQRPFAAPSLAALATAVIDGRLSPTPPDVELPQWLHRAVVRGLSNDPASRWPSMRALLDALAAGQLERTSSSRGATWAAVVSAALAVTAALAWSTRAHEDPAADACADAGVAMQEVWNPTRAAELSRALSSASPAFGEQSATRVNAKFNDYARAWVHMRREACEATQRGVQSEALLDLRMSCLNRRLTQVDALVTALGEADFTVVSRAVELASSLEPLTDCADTSALQRSAAPQLDAHARETVARGDQLIARGQTANRLARYEEASELATQAIELTRPLAEHPVHAQALQLLATAQAAQGANDAAETTYDRAAEAALRSGDGERLAGVLIAQGNHIGFGLARPSEGQRLLGYARALLEAHPGSKLEANLENTLGLFAYARGDNNVAIAHFERVRELRVEQWGEDHPQTANILNNLGALAFAKGDYAASRAYHEQTLAIWRGAYGPEHPDVAVSLNNLAGVADVEGDYPRAEQLYREALALREQLLGRDHPDIASTSSNLGISLESAKRPADAILAHRRALEIYARSYGETHPKLAGPLTGIARCLLALGDEDQLEQAQVYAERSLQIRSAAEVAPYDLAQSNIALAKVLHAQGTQRVRALELALAARDLLAPVEGAEIEQREVAELLERMDHP